MKKILFASASIIIITFLYVMNSVFIKKNASEAFDDYKPNENDILFLGTSHVGCGIEPFYLYNKTGIRSYNLKT